jgi:Skp family chaperone for outer membrane proteins
MEILLRKLLTEKLTLMLNFDKDTKKGYLWLLLIFVIILIIGNIFQFMYINQTFENSDYLKNEVIKIQSDIKKYQSENKKLSEKILAYEKMLVKIDSSISVNEQKIDKLKISTNEKINSFKSYDAIMWEKFFTDRYKK